MRPIQTPPPLESEVQKPVVEYALSLGLLATKLDVRNNIGVMDYIFWMPGGRPLLVEFKKDGKEPTPVQQHKMDRFRRLGYAVESCNDKDAGKALIRDYVEAAKSTFYTRQVKAWQAVGEANRLT